MLEKIKDTISNSKILQFIIILVAGIAIGALFYPTKHIEETISQKYEKIVQQEKEQHSIENKKIQEDYSKLQLSSLEQKKELEVKVSSLTTQVHELKSKQKTSYYKLIKPDGTIEVKKFSETDVEESSKVVTQIQQEFKEKVSSIETKWETIHKQRVEELQSKFDSKEKTYQQEISEYKSKRVEDINAKHAGLEVGLNTRGNVYLHPSYDLFGPLYIGVNAEGNIANKNDMSAGAGLGIRF